MMHAQYPAISSADPSSLASAKPVRTDVAAVVINALQNEGIIHQWMQ